MKSTIANQDRLIVALDVPNIESAKNLVNKLGDSVTFYKVGLELCMSRDYFELIEWLGNKNKKIFADVKLFDISATVGKAVKNLSKYPQIKFVTIHAANKEIMLAAANNKKNMQILAVTVLTCFDKEDLNDMGCPASTTLESLAIERAVLAKECGIDGVISSGLEVKNIKEATNKDFLVVTPGIRLENSVRANTYSDDQKRTVDVKTAFKNGADYIVVGRPINQAKNPREVTNQIQKEINSIHYLYI